MPISGFCTPEPFAPSQPGPRLLVNRARFHLRQAEPLRVPTSSGDLQAYVLRARRPRRRLACSRPRLDRRGGLHDGLRRAVSRRGFRSVLFDLPAHGKSSGRRTSLIACAHAVREVAEALGPLQFAVAHSLGGLATLLAGGGGTPMPRAYPFQGYRARRPPQSFLRGDGSLQPGARSFAGGAAGLRATSRTHRPSQDRRLHGAEAAGGDGPPALLLHARDDAELPFRNAEEIASAARRTRLQPFDDLGHRKILYAPPVVRAALTYVVRQCEPRR